MTLLDIISDALTSIGQLGTGRSVSPEQGNQGLRKANRLLQRWSVQRLLLYEINTRAFGLSAAVQDYTVGPVAGATFVQPRPVLVEAGQATIPGTSMQNPLNILSKPEWDALPDRGVICGTNAVPASVWPEYSYPNMALHFTPIPSTIVQVRLGTWEILQAFATIFSELALPEVYEEALTMNLAIVLAPDYDVEPSQTLQQQAADALGQLMKFNAAKFKGALGESQTLSSPVVQPVLGGGGQGG